MFTQEALVILERVLTGAARPSLPRHGHGTSGQSARDNVQAAAALSAAAATAASGLLLRPAEGAGFVTGWPFVPGTPGVEVL